MNSLAIVAGLGGCDRHGAASKYTPTGRHTGKKIVAVGVEVAANITNFIYTDDNKQAITITNDAWLGTAIAASGLTSYIPLGVRADSVTVASGTIWVYFG